MTIFYASDTERWEDTEDNEWGVGMTPEGNDEFTEFESREEFEKWYKSCGS